MNQNLNSKPYDLEERTLQFAKRTALYCKNLSKNTINIEYIKQVGSLRFIWNLVLGIWDFVYM